MVRLLLSYRSAKHSFFKVFHNFPFHAPSDFNVQVTGYMSGIYKVNSGLTTLVALLPKHDVVSDPLHTPPEGLCNREFNALPLFRYPFLRLKVGLQARIR